jgi:ketosteroid isomerase-like protein
MTDDTALDEWKIGRVLARYCRFLDDRQVTRCTDLFAPDAVFNTMGRSLHGRDEIAAFLGPDAEPKPSRPGSLHLLSNIVIDVAGDTAEAESDWVLLSRTGDEGRTTIRLAGRFRDRLDRHGDDWLIRERTAVALSPLRQRRYDERPL